MSKSDNLKKIITANLRIYSPGDKIPSRNFLKNKYNASRATIDKIIESLQREGYLFSVKGSGTFLTEKLFVDNNRDISNWGVILPNVASDICPLFLRGIEDFAHEHLIHIIVCNTDNDPAKEKECLLRLAEAAVSGIISIPPILPENNFPVYRQVIDQNIPFVFCVRFIEGLEHIPYVASNDFYGGYLAAKHLINCGYKNIGFISRHHYRTSIDRFCGYTAALHESNMSSIPGHSLLRFDEVEDLRAFYSSAMSLKTPPDAFVCLNDSVAMLLYQVIKESDKAISENIGVIGYDNTNICELLSPKLTSMEFKNYEMGKKAAVTLYKIINKIPDCPDTQLLQPEVVVRESCLGPDD